MYVAQTLVSSPHLAGYFRQLRGSGGYGRNQRVVDGGLPDLLLEQIDRLLKQGGSGIQKGVLYIDLFMD